MIGRVRGTSAGGESDREVVKFVHAMYGVRGFFCIVFFGVLTVNTVNTVNI